MEADPAVHAPVALPRITIQFCTQCKWMLRAAYFAQELLSTFSTAIGEVALLPSTGGVFTVDIVTALPSSASVPPHEQEGLGTAMSQTQATRLWDRKSEGGFPETKELKRRVRDVIEPGRDLGHVDGKKGKDGIRSEVGMTSTERATGPGEVDRVGKNAGGERAGGVGPVSTARRPDVGEGKEMRRFPDGSVCEDCK